MSLSTNRLATTARVGLAVAHPGHELRLTRWIEQRRPTVFILTSGSRHGVDRARVDASRRLLETLGARPGQLFGQCLDRDVYAWIMAGETRRFSNLARQLADHIVDQRLDAVVTDAWQLYNVTHDIWHLVTRAAVALASERLGRRVACFDYAVTPPSLALRSMGETHEIRRLDDGEVRRKQELAAVFPAIAQDVAEVLAVGGPAFIATESLHLPRPMPELLPRPGETPIYEQFGEMRVQAGLYDSVLRWRHAAPIAAELIAMLRDQAVAA
ncbi:hypothetical protein LJR225_004145 [Phenylobacterium sp. LjRoot225]|uniref:hypothetical protein n=1 Tax=Phenylobacterium sp. LjRoot225 TaxID=3342285 RepID=UPI003ED07F33